MAARPKTLPPIHPNAGLEARYRRQLEALVDEMNRSLVYWIKASYRVNPPEMAADSSPAVALREAVRRLAARWQKRFDEAGPALARYFTMSAYRRTDAALAKILRKAGFTVELKLTRPVNDVLQASMAEQVGLIKSIAAQHLQQVEGLVMRSVQEGRSAAELADELVERYDVTRRRAALIARDQSNKSSAVIQRARQQELGIERAVWVHSHAGNKPRPSHVKAGADRVVYDVAEGWFDPHEGKRIWPGMLINCKCVSRGVISGAVIG